MIDIFNLDTLSNDFYTEFHKLYQQIKVNQQNNFIEMNYLLIKDFIHIYDLHNEFTIESKLIKKTNTYKEVKRYFANEFNGLNIDKYLPIKFNRHTNTYTFYKNEDEKRTMLRLQNAIYVKTYILDQLNCLDEQTFIIECLKLYNRIYHKKHINITIDLLLVYMKIAYNKHDFEFVSKLQKFSDSTYQKVKKYEWKKEDFGSLVDSLSLEENYNIWLKTDYAYIKEHNEGVKSVGFRTFQTLLKKLGIKKKYANRCR